MPFPAFGLGFNFGLSHLVLAMALPKEGPETV